MISIEIPRCADRVEGEEAGTGDDGPTTSNRESAAAGQTHCGSHEDVCRGAGDNGGHYRTREKMISIKSLQLSPAAEEREKPVRRRDNGEHYRTEKIMISIKIHPLSPAAQWTAETRVGDNEGYYREEKRMISIKSLPLSPKAARCWHKAIRVQCERSVPRFPRCMDGKGCSVAVNHRPDEFGLASGRAPLGASREGKRAPEIARTCSGRVSESGIGNDVRKRGERSRCRAKARAGGLHHEREERAEPFSSRGHQRSPV